MGEEFIILFTAGLAPVIEALMASLTRPDIILEVGEFFNGAVKDAWPFVSGGDAECPHAIGKSQFA